jgi:hypothetical protein
MELSWGPELSLPGVQTHWIYFRWTQVRAFRREPEQRVGLMAWHSKTSTRITKNEHSGAGPRQDDGGGLN